MRGFESCCPCLNMYLKKKNFLINQKLIKIKKNIKIKKKYFNNFSKIILLKNRKIKEKKLNIFSTTRATRFFFFNFKLRKKLINIKNRHKYKKHNNKKNINKNKYNNKQNMDKIKKTKKTLFNMKSKNKYKKTKLKKLNNAFFKKINLFFILKNKNKKNTFKKFRLMRFRYSNFLKNKKKNNILNFFFKNKHAAVGAKYLRLHFFFKKQNHYILREDLKSKFFIFSPFYKFKKNNFSFINFLNTRINFVNKLFFYLTNFLNQPIVITPLHSLNWFNFFKTNFFLLKIKDNYRSHNVIDLKKFFFFNKNNNFFKILSKKNYYLKIKKNFFFFNNLICPTSLKFIYILNDYYSFIDLYDYYRKFFYKVNNCSVSRTTAKKLTFDCLFGKLFKQLFKKQKPLSLILNHKSIFFGHFRIFNEKKIIKKKMFFYWKNKNKKINFLKKNNYFYFFKNNTFKNKIKNKNFFFKYSSFKNALKKNNFFSFNKIFSTFFQDIQFFFFNPLFFKIYNNATKTTFESTDYLINYQLLTKRANIFSNILTDSTIFSFSLTRRILQNLNLHRLQSFYSYLPYETMLKFIEYSSGKRVVFKVDPFIMKNISIEDTTRCFSWSQRIKIFRKNLGPRLFLLESLQIITLCLRLKDPYVLSNWMLSMLYKISFWKYKMFLRYMQYILRNFFWSYFPEFKIKGLKFQLKGKVSVAGNARTRTVFTQIGSLSHSTQSYKVLTNLNLLRTFTGVISFRTWLVF